jgi:hypothetical protein
MRKRRTRFRFHRKQELAFFACASVRQRTKERIRASKI